MTPDKIYIDHFNGYWSKKRTSKDQAEYIRSDIVEQMVKDASKQSDNLESIIAKANKYSNNLESLLSELNEIDQRITKAIKR